MATAPGRPKTLEQFERESEQNRAALAATIDDLRTTVIDEVTDFRKRLSLQHLTSEVSGYARANPLRSLAIGAGLAVPLAGVARRVPVPILLIGAGLALTRPGVKNIGDQAGDHLARAKSRLGDLAGAVADGASDLKAGVSSRVSDVAGSAKWTVAGAAASATARLGGVAEAGASATSQALDMKSQALDSGASLMRSGSDMMSDARAATARAASQTQTKASDLFHGNPLLVAGAGLAIGALIAAIIPTTNAESRLLEKTAPDLKQKASDLIDDGYEAASGAVGKVFDGTVGRAREQGLSVEGAQGAAGSLGDKLGAVIEAAAGTGDHSETKQDHDHGE